MATAETAKLVAELTLKDKMSAGVRSANANISKLEKTFGRTTTSIGKLGHNLERGLVIGAAAAAGGLITVVNAARDYESAFAGVRKTVDATEAEFSALSDSFRQMAREIPISASELASLGETAGALGIEGTANIKEFVRVTALLGVTTDLTAQDAATSLGIIANVLHLTSAEYSAFASSLVALGNAGASTESQIIEIAQRAGAAGELIGLSTAQVLGFSSAIASLGIESEAGGTSLQKFLIETTKFAAASGKELDIMAKVAGASAKTFKKAFDEDAGAALQRFLANLGELSEAEQFAVLEDLGFNEARMSRTLLGLANNTALVTDQMNVAGKSFAENTALTKEAEQRFATFDSQLQITKNVLNDIAITIGSKLLPKITPLLKRFNEFVNNNQGKIEQFGTDLATTFERVADAIAKVDWTPFIEGLKFTAEVAGAAIAAFRSLPADVQKMIVAGVAVNKATGGLITSLAADVGGGIFKLVFERGSSPANPLFVSAIGGGLGGGGVTPVGGKGPIGKIASVALPVTVIAFSLQAAADLAGITGAGAEGHIGPTGELVRQNTALAERIANATAGIAQLETRAANGDTFAAKQLVEQKALLAALLAEQKKTPTPTGGGLFGAIAAMGRTIVNALPGGGDRGDRPMQEIPLSKEATKSLHEANRIGHEQLVAFRDNKINKEDLATIPKLLTFYQTSLAPSQKSMETDMAKLKEIQAAYAASGDTATAATVSEAIAALQIEIDEGNGTNKTELEKNRMATVTSGLQSVAAQDAAKAAQVAAATAAGASVSSAVERKKMSYTSVVNLTTNTVVSIHDIIRTETTHKHLQKFGV